MPDTAPETEVQEQPSIEYLIDLIATAGRTVYQMRYDALEDGNTDLYDDQDIQLMLIEGYLGKAFNALQELYEIMPDPEEVGH